MVTSLLAMAVLAGCGFQLRGAYQLPYESLYIAGGTDSVIGVGLKRNILASGGRVVDSPAEAQAAFYPTGEARDTLTLALSSAGTVRERRLRYTYSYRIVDKKGHNLVAPATVELFRDITYSDSTVLAKSQEADLLWRDMENDLVQQLMRRLATAKPDFSNGE